jgi:hypothetical protein
MAPQMLLNDVKNRERETTNRHKDGIYTPKQDNNITEASKREDTTTCVDFYYSSGRDPPSSACDIALGAGKTYNFQKIGSLACMGCKNGIIDYQASL